MKSTANLEASQKPLHPRSESGGGGGAGAGEEGQLGEAAVASRFCRNCGRGCDGWGEGLRGGVTCVVVTDVVKPKAVEFSWVAVRRCDIQGIGLVTDSKNCDRGRMK